MEKEGYSMHWKCYTDHFKGMMQRMLVSQENSDVTLVCDDLRTVKAHKNILSASSPIFQKMFDLQPGKELFLYMRGIKFHILASIIEFIYLGQVNLQENFVEDFLAIARSLEVTGLNEPDHRGLNESIEKNKIDDRVEAGFCKTEPEDTAEENQDLTKYNTKEAEHKDVTRLKESYEAFKCKECGKEFTSYLRRQRHKRSVHDGVRYPCNFCDHKATFRQNLWRHVKTMHKSKEM